jgi:peptidyl-tRNA hydrolase, PTH1 family
MATTIRAIVGLGNPGPEYAQTRHNAGALWIQHLTTQHGVKLRPEKRFHGHYGKLVLNHSEVHLLFPSTFMNRSGKALHALGHFYKIAPENILVAYDELDLDPGVIRLKQGGGHGGHNGLRDIIKALGGNKEFPRLRFGIGHPGDKAKVVNYVLSKFSKEDWGKLQYLFAELDSWLVALINGDWALAMNHLHRKA